MNSNKKKQWLATFFSRCSRKIYVHGSFTCTWNCLPFRSTWVQPRFLLGSCYSIFSFMCIFCRSFFVLLYFYFWPLCCLFFFDVQILITPLVSTNSSYWYSILIQVRVHWYYSTDSRYWHIKTLPFQDLWSINLQFSV
jgi:hypothetical protein